MGDPPVSVDSLPASITGHDGSERRLIVAQVEPNPVHIVALCARQGGIGAGLARKWSNSARYGPNMPSVQQRPNSVNLGLH